MVSVGAPAVGVIELGDDGEVAGAFGQPEIGPEPVRADLVDLGRQLRQPGDELGDLGLADGVLEPIGDRGL